MLIPGSKYFFNRPRLRRITSCIWVYDPSSRLVQTKFMMVVDRSHPRSYHNLRAFRRATELQSDLFWLSRSFPSNLHASLTRPVRRHAYRLTRAVWYLWRNRKNGGATEAATIDARSEIEMLNYYLLRAETEGALRPGARGDFEARFAELTVQIKRLRRSLATVV